MNFLEMLHNQLKDKHLTDEEKLRLIYLADCQFFSFDSRWFYSSLFNDMKTRDEMFFRKIDLKNVSDYKIICYPNAAEILKVAGQEFTNLQYEVLNCFGHYKLRANGSFGKITLDPVHSDFTRMKIGFRPTNYKLNEDKTVPEERIKYQKEIDQSLGINFKSSKEVFGPERNTIIDNLNAIVQVINSSHLKYYSDAATILRLYGLYDKVRLSILFEGTSYATYVNKDYDFHRFIYNESENIFFEICKIGDEYKLNQVDKARVRSIASNEEYRRKQVI